MTTEELALRDLESRLCTDSGIAFVDLAGLMWKAAAAFSEWGVCGLSPEGGLDTDGLMGALEIVHWRHVCHCRDCWDGMMAAAALESAPDEFVEQLILEYEATRRSFELPNIDDEVQGLTSSPWATTGR